MDRLLFGSLDEAAGVDDDDICDSGVIGELIGLKATEHDLRVYEVFGTA